MDLTIIILMNIAYVKMRHKRVLLWENNFSILLLLINGTNGKRHVCNVPYLESLEIGFCDFMKFTKTAGLHLQNNFLLKKLHIAQKMKLKF